jgi:hypothetical protein
MINQQSTGEGSSFSLVLPKRKKARKRKIQDTQTDRAAGAPGINPQAD